MQWGGLQAVEVIAEAGALVHQRADVVHGHVEAEEGILVRIGVEAIAERRGEPENAWIRAVDENTGWHVHGQFVEIHGFEGLHVEPAVQSVDRDPVLSGQRRQLANDIGDALHIITGDHHHVHSGSIQLRDQVRDVPLAGSGHQDRVTQAYRLLAEGLLQRPLHLVLQLPFSRELRPAQHDVVVR